MKLSEFKQLPVTEKIFFTTIAFSYAVCFIAAGFIVFAQLIDTTT